MSNEQTKRIKTDQTERWAKIYVETNEKYRITKEDFERSFMNHVKNTFTVGVDWEEVKRLVLEEMNWC